MKSTRSTSNVRTTNQEQGHAGTLLAGPEAKIVGQTPDWETDQDGRRAHLGRGNDSAASSTLIVGASPAGLIAAIRLREEGVDVRVIDDLTADGTHCFPTVLHPRTLRLLSSIGVAAPLEWRGHRVARLAVYMDGRRHAVLELPSAGEPGSDTMTLPQDVLRGALLRRLSDLGTQVEWQTRLAAIEQSVAKVRVRLVRRERADGRRRRFEPEWIDVAAQDVHAQFVIGADGTQSSVRRQLGIEWLPSCRRQFYITYETADQRAGNEAQLVIYEGFGNTIYPFQSGVSRFTFEVTNHTSAIPEVARLRQLLESRMPWYAVEVDRSEWLGTTTVSPGVAARFGVGRVWLTGDAAHSNGPLGGQDLNVGMVEANHLALRVVQHIDRRGAIHLDLPYTEQRHLAWQRLWAIDPRTTGVGFDSIRRDVARVLPSLPASGDDLDDLLAQLHDASTQ